MTIVPYLISGLLFYLAEPPFGIAPLAFVCLVPLLYAAGKSAGYRSAALGGFAAGSAFFLPGLFWLTSTTVLGWAALSLYCAAYVGAFAAMARKTSSVVLLAAFWVVLEYVRGVVAFTGFPWLLLSHSQYRFLHFTQFVDVIGGYGLSGVVVAINVLLFRAVIHRQRKPAMIAAVVFAGVVSYGYIRIHTIVLQRSIRVAMVQASVPQEMKEALQGAYDPEGVFSRYLDASTKIPTNPPNDLLVWPETVVLSPYTLNVEPGVLKEEYAAQARFAQNAIGTLARTHGAYFLAGATSFLPSEHGYVSDVAIAEKIPSGNWGKAYNSAYLFDPAGRYVDRYDKMHLVPFGEYIPLRNLFPFLASLVPFDASLSAGARQTIFPLMSRERLLRFGTLICYEDTDSELARRLRRAGADFFVNVSNDAWFGLSELDQHFVTAQFRAVENRAGVVRSGNNGISGLIDPLGRAEILMDKNAIGGAAGDLWLTDSRSLYTQAGDWPAVLLSLAVLAVGAAKQRSVSVPL